ncbi:MAG: response regulator transcription factor [Byssovorax sp.]
MPKSLEGGEASSGGRAGSPAPRILLVEDTPRLADSIARGLGEEGFVVEIASTGAAALARLSRRDLDAMILDLGLPDLDGIEVLDRTRTVHEAMPILVLTARDAVASRVRALALGADDYLVKPFAFDELVARARALLRRAAGPRWAPLACGDVRLDPGELHARVGERVVELSPRERGLLELLLRRRDQAVGRAEILRDLFGYDFDPGTNIVDVHVAHLRRKLEGSEARIETVRGVGYRLKHALDGHD